MSTLFSYYGLGLRALNNASLGIQVAGDNIANVDTPGYARRRLEISNGFPFQVKGGYLDNGPNIIGLRRIEDRLLQASLEREIGTSGFNRQRLDSLRRLESSFGTLDGESVLKEYGRFTEAFTTLAGTSESVSARRAAITAADSLATSIRETYDRLRAQQQDEDRAIADQVEEINQLAQQLGDLNVEIQTLEGDGSVAAPLRDQRQLVVERLAELTGGVSSASENGKIGIQLRGGPTLVGTESALGLTTTVDTSGALRIVAAGGFDVTDQLRSGELGARLSVRDDSIQDRIDDLNLIAADLITRSNAITTGAIDLGGNAGGPLFVPDPAPATDAAATIAASASLLDDPGQLAISITGSAGDGSGAEALSALFEGTSGGLGGRTPLDVLTDSLSALGQEIAQADVDVSVSGDLVATLEARRQEVSGVSLDEEAVELIRNQRSYEAAARFMQVINDITEIAVNL